MEKLLLTPNNTLEGSRVARIRIRPVRLAYVVPNDQPSIAVRVIESCCLTWGGASHFLIPYDKVVGFTEEWRRVLDWYDPDDIVDCAGIAGDEEAYRKELGQFVHRWDKPEESLFLLGTHQYSALNALGYSREKRAGDFVIQPMLEKTDPLYLPVVARWGHLYEKFVEDRLEYHRVPIDWRYKDFIGVAELEFREANVARILAGETDTSRFIRGKGGGTYTFAGLPSMTMIGIPWQGPSYSYGGSPERPQYDKAYVNLLLVTGSPNSVGDLCLYWNLRSQRSHQINNFPLWIPLPSLISPEGKEAVRFAISRVSAREAEGLGPLRGLHVISTSVEESELKRLFPTDVEVSSFETGRMSEYLSCNVTYGYVAEKELAFSQGRARIPRSEVDLVDRLAPFDRVAREVSIQGWQLPKNALLQHKISGPILRISKDGLEHFFTSGYGSDLTDIGLPSAWTVMTSLFEDAGYSCELSDKGRLALAVLGLVGGVDGLHTLARKPVFDLLAALSSASGRQGAVQAVRRYLVGLGVRTSSGDDASRLVEQVLRSAPVDSVMRSDTSYGDVAGVLAKVDALETLTWLLEKRLLFRGARLTCPICGLGKWYPVGRFGEFLLCDGCQREVPFPGNLDATQWRYRINELYARAYDQGVIPHLLLIRALLPELRQGFEESTLGFHPGVIIRVLDATVAERTGIDDMELDFVEIREGKPILGECKVHGGSIEKSYLEKLTVIAGLIGCDRVILATMTDFSASRGVIEEVARVASCEIETMEGSDLLSDQ